MTIPQPIAWTPDFAVRILDQTLLPDTETYLDARDGGRRRRGDPHTPGARRAAHRHRRRDGAARWPLRGGARPTLETVRAASAVLGATRPTAVNLRWALARMERRAAGAAGAGEDLAAGAPRRGHGDLGRGPRHVRADRRGRRGADRRRRGRAHPLQRGRARDRRDGHRARSDLHRCTRPAGACAVVADETRPLLQGSRLTAWELARAGVPVTVIADGMAASRLRRGDITCVIVGADRIAANGDVANKIGTYGLALAARAHGVPFYVAAPSSTVDLATPDGAGDPDRGARGRRGGRAGRPAVRRPTACRSGTRPST